MDNGEFRIDKEKTYGKSTHWVFPHGFIIVLMHCDGDYIYNISKRINMTHPNVSKIIHEFRKLNIVDTEKTGRILKIKLTKKGLRLKSLYNLIYDVMRDRAGV